MMLGHILKKNCVCLFLFISFTDEYVSESEKCEKINYGSKK